MTINELSQAFAMYRELKRISNSLHRQDENACNYRLTPRQEKRVEKLEAKAQELALVLGFKAYHQSDPRGCSLYLIDFTMDDTNYHRGIAI